MEFKLAPEALYSTKAFNENLLRSRRRPDGRHLPEHLTDVDCPDQCWENAGARAKKVDPDGEKALARLQKYLSESK